MQGGLMKYYALLFRAKYPAFWKNALELISLFDIAFTFPGWSLISRSTDQGMLTIICITSCAFRSLHLINVNVEVLASGK